MRYIILMTILFLACFSYSIGKKSMWGARKKKEDKNKREFREQAIKDRFVMDVDPKRGGPGRDKRSSNDPYDEVLIDQILTTVKELDIDTIVDSTSKALRDFIASDEFDNMVTPEIIHQITSQLPKELKETPAFQDIFASADFTNPASLKLQLLEGISVISMQAIELQDAMTDRAPIAEFLNGVPREFKQLISYLLTGGNIEGNLSRLISTLPGLDGEQRAFLLHMVSSFSRSSSSSSSSSSTIEKADLVTQMLQQMDDATIEEVRVEYLSNPELSEALFDAGLGFEPALLLDQEQFAEWFRASASLAAGSIDSVLHAYDNGNTDEWDELGGRRRTSMAF